jgi:hypothetical protein
MATKVKKSFAERQQERVEKAKMAGAMVLTPQSFDTRLVINIIRQVDRQFRTSRDRLFQEGFEVEKVEPYFRQWQELEKTFNEFAKSFSKLTGVRYYDPMKGNKDDESEAVKE